MRNFSTTYNKAVNRAFCAVAVAGYVTATPPPIV